MGSRPGEMDLISLLVLILCTVGGVIVVWALTGNSTSALFLGGPAGLFIGFAVLMVCYLVVWINSTGRR